MNTIKQHFFIASAHKGAGKTFVAGALLQQAHDNGVACYGIKPISTACAPDDNGQLISNDGAVFEQLNTKKLHADLVAPIKFRHSFEPAISAQFENVTLNATRIQGMLRASMGKRASHVLVEGCHSWFSPINARETMADVARLINLPVILVVDIAHPDISSVLLTLKAIQASGLRLAGWVATETATSSDVTEQARIQQLNLCNEFIVAPNLGVIRFNENAVDKLTWPADLEFEEPTDEEKEHNTTGIKTSIKLHTSPQI